MVNDKRFYLTSMFNNWGLMKVRVLDILPVVGVCILISAYIMVQSPPRLLVATTTSLYDTGLLDLIGEAYFENTGHRVGFIAVGTGLALEHAKRGDVDAVFVHAPTLESEILQENACGLRKIIAYNYFVIVGPANDPAHIAGLSPTQAMRRIAETGSLWVSRADNSGTNNKEIALWEGAGYEYENLRSKDWFFETGTGMGNTLLVANEKGAYTLSDTGTFLKYKKENLITLEKLVSESEELLNVYSVMVVNPEKHPFVKFELAAEFVEFLISPGVQQLIAEFGKEEFGEVLFYPAVEILENENSAVAQWIKETAFMDNSECPPHLRFGRADLYE